MPATCVSLRVPHPRFLRVGLGSLFSATPTIPPPSPSRSADILPAPSSRAKRGIPLLFLLGNLCALQVLCVKPFSSLPGRRSLITGRHLSSISTASSNPHSTLNLHTSNHFPPRKPLRFRHRHYIHSVVVYAGRQGQWHTPTLRSTPFPTQAKIRPTSGNLQSHSATPHPPAVPFRSNPALAPFLFLLSSYATPL